MDYESPEIIASYVEDELVVEAAVCTRYCDFASISSRPDGAQGRPADDPALIPGPSRNPRAEGR